MPMDQIDRILDQVRKRRTGNQQRCHSPIAISKAHFQFKKGPDRCYLPKPPPPKLRVVKKCGEKEKLQSGGKHRYKSWKWGRDPQTGEVKTESDSQEWQTDYHSDRVKGPREANIEWYPWNPEDEQQPYDEDYDEDCDMNEELANTDEGQDMEDQSWEQPNGSDDPEMLQVAGQEEEDQWYYDWENEGEQEQQQEQETDEQWQMDPNEEWDPNDQEWGPQQEEEQAGQQDDYGNAQEDPEQPMEKPIPAPTLTTTGAGQGKKGPRVVPLNKGKGKNEGAKTGKGTVGHPTPLTHPSVKQNPLAKGKGLKSPIVHPIFDPQHPINRERGWTPNPMQWQTMPPPSTGWIPPAPQPIGIEYRQLQQPCGHNPIMKGKGYGEWMSPWGPRYPATPQMQPVCSSHQYNPSYGGTTGVRIDTDTGNEPSSDTDDRLRGPKRGIRHKLRRRVKHEAPKKRHVMLNIGGHEVKASYWEP